MVGGVNVEIYALYGRRKLCIEICGFLIRGGVLGSCVVNGVAGC